MAGHPLKIQRPDPVWADYGRGFLVPMAVRIGITGHRPNKLGAGAAVSRAIRDVLDDIAVACDLLNERDRRADAPYFDHDQAPALWILSSLAEGADRMAAKALDRPFNLVAVLPFAADEYRKDFMPAAAAAPPNEGSVEDPATGTVADFDALLAQAERVVVLDGGHQHGSRRNAAYWEAGRFVVGHCDILVAAWDGRPADGKGGTGDVVEEALRQGVPVVRVHSDDAATTIILPPPAGDLIGAVPADATAYDANALRGILAERLRPPRVMDRNDRRQRTFVAEPGFTPCRSPPPDFVSKAPIRYDARWSRAAGLFDLVRSLIVRRGYVIARRRPEFMPDVEAQPLPATADRRPLDRLYAAYFRADALSYHYSRAYRSVIVAIYLLGTMAVGCAILALLLKDWKTALTGVELVLLLVIAGLVVMDRFLYRFHRRWLDYRVLAELLRPTPFLALLGQPTRLHQLGAAAESGHDGHGPANHLPSRAWAFAVYRAIVRHAGIAGADFTDPDYLENCRWMVRRNLIGDQILYNHDTHTRSGAMDRRLKVVATGVFAATVAIVIAKLFVVWPQAPWIAEVWRAMPELRVHVEARHAAVTGTLGFFAAFLPAFAAACYALRSHNELELISLRSATMRDQLVAVRDTLDKLRGDTLGHAGVAAATRHAADIMMHDSADWLEIFRVKESEAG